MARIGFIHVTISCCALLGLSLTAQTPPEPLPPPPPPQGPEMEGGDKPDRDRRGQDGPGKKEPGMGRRAEGFPMFGPGMGGPQFEKMVELALGPQKDLDEALKSWPRIQEKGPEAQERFMKQLENFRRFLKGQALRDAEELKIPVKPEEEDAYVKKYWKLKLEVDQTLRKEMEPRRKELMDKMNADLKKQFGS